MLANIPPLPNPPPPYVARFYADGKPTTAQITYEQSLLAFLRAVRAILVNL